ncbi:MAG: PIN domain-containing protein [Archangium sp.]|nr:PIN domain-containing protein [Archangium sp.]
MSWLLDTNICIAWLKGSDAKLRDRVLKTAPAELWLCSVVKAELLYGARKSTRVEENLRRLDAFFSELGALPFDDRAATHYGLIRAQLERAGTPIGPNDLMVAAIALAADATLVTRNGAEFRRVPGLRVETW